MSSIDLSRLPAPKAIEEVSFEALLDAMRADLVQRLPSIEPTLALESTVVAKLLQVVAYQRTLDRSRVNDAIKAVLAPFARGSDLDHVAARQGIQRLTVASATANTPAIMETDAALLRRYLLSFDRASAGSASGYLYEVWTAVPGLQDAAVVGRDIHGRRGDTDIVIIGADGAAPSPAEIAAVSSAVRADHVKPEAVAVSVVPATRVLYDVSLAVIIGKGPDPEVVRLEAEARVLAAARARMQIGDEVPAGLLAGAAYGANIVRVIDFSPVIIQPDPYSVPILASISVITQDPT